jgi:EAL domain-containing protein (putative c-di-GMP-specific phosphodiesterase class I)
VLRQACTDCLARQRHGLAPLRVAVNGCPSELRRRNFARDTLDVIGKLAHDPRWGIDIEITEGALADDSSSVVHALRLLSAAGIKISIDDFGTGFSSLGRLSELPVETLKIDRAFTSGVPSDPKIYRLVSTIIDLAHAFDMSMVAEGVETQAQLEYLSAEGCDKSRGYRHSRPVP